MPYVVLKKGPGYKVCKKSDKSVCFSKKPLPKERAEDQRKAMYANEAMEGHHMGLDTDEVGHKLKFNNLTEFPDQNMIHVSYDIEGREDETVVLCYFIGDTISDVDYHHMEINGEEFEDPRDPKTEAALQDVGLTPDDIELAGEDSYDKIAEHFTPGPPDMFKSGYEDKGVNSDEWHKKLSDEQHESLSFEAYFKTIMEGHGGKLVSNCCGARPSPLSMDVEKPGDVGICSECKEHAEFELEEE